MSTKNSILKANIQDRTYPRHDLKGLRVTQESVSPNEHVEKRSMTSWYGHQRTKQVLTIASDEEGPRKWNKPSLEALTNSERGQTA